MLKAIYTTGSSLFLPNSNDKDVVYYYETKEERREALIKYKHDSDKMFTLIMFALSRSFQAVTSITL